MSYDVSLTYGDLEKELGNYTYNCAEMFSRGSGMSLNRLNGMKASEAIAILEKGWLNMANKPEEMKTLAPENGWGTYQGFKNYIKNILEACKDNPDATLEVN